MAKKLGSIVIDGLDKKKINIGIKQKIAQITLINLTDPELISIPRTMLGIYLC